MKMQVCGSAAVYLAVFAVLQLSPAPAQAFPVQFGLSPDNSQSLLIDTLNSAQKEILINIYQFDSPEIQKALIGQISRGVTVQILLEGQPMGKISAAGMNTVRTITQAMQSSANEQDHFFLMTSNGASKTRRYRYDHAKYVVIDGQKALIASENFTTTGHPVPGLVGNRGWEVILDDAGTASQLTSTFETDSSTQHGDVRDITHSPGAAESPVEAEGKIRHQTAIPSNSGDATEASLVTSPNSEAGIIDFIRSASSTLEMEQMSLPLNWKSGSSSSLNPFVAEAIAAAKRGVKVRILLNDDTVFSEDSSSEDGSSTANQDTEEYLNQTARCLGVDLEAKIVDINALEITYIHNKGMIVDGKRVFVSSINGTRNAVMNNREVAVNLKSTDAATYFEGAFNLDWSLSKSLQSQSLSDCSQNAALAGLAL